MVIYAASNILAQGRKTELYCRSLCDYEWVRNAPNGFITLGTTHTTSKWAYSISIWKWWAGETRFYFLHDIVRAPHIHLLQKTLVLLRTPIYFCRKYEYFLLLPDSFAIDEMSSGNIDHYLRVGIFYIVYGWCIEWMRWERPCQLILRMIGITKMYK